MKNMFSSHGHLVKLVKCSGQQWARGHRTLARKPVRVHMKSPLKDAEDTVQRYQEALAGDSGRGGGKSSQGQGSLQEAGHAKREKLSPPSDAEAFLQKNLRYKLLSEAKDHDRALLTNMKSQKYRREHNLFIAEGFRLIREALEHGASPQALYFTRLKLVAALKPTDSFELEDLNALNDLPLYKAPYKTLQTWSSVTTSPGILGVFKIPESSASPPRHHHRHYLPLILVLDEIREPGNLGGILRTAAAVGVNQVLLMKGCCNPWETKVVRAGCGAHFRLTLTQKVTWDVLANHVPEGVQLLLADTCQEKDLAETQPHTPPTNTCLDAAPDDYEDATSVYEVDSEGNKVVIDPSYNDPEHLQHYQNAQLPTESYDQMRLREGWAALVIGGETGVSNAAKKFVSVHCGRKVSIPLANRMDSLNSGVAAGIIMYEVQRQLQEVATHREERERKV